MSLAAVSMRGQTPRSFEVFSGFLELQFVRFFGEGDWDMYTCFFNISN